jgi:hypothetical protein
MEGTVGLIGFRPLALESFEGVPSGRFRRGDRTIVIAMTEGMNAARQGLSISF